MTGLGLLVAADQLTNKDWAALNKGKGDAFMILGATLYGFSTSRLNQLHSFVNGTDGISCSERN